MLVAVPLSAVYRYSSYCTGLGLYYMYNIIYISGLRHVSVQQLLFFCLFVSFFLFFRNIYLDKCLSLSLIAANRTNVNLCIKNVQIYICSGCETPSVINQAIIIIIVKDRYIYIYIYYNSRMRSIIMQSRNIITIVYIYIQKIQKKTTSADWILLHRVAHLSSSHYRITQIYIHTRMITSSCEVP